MTNFRQKQNLQKFDLFLDFFTPRVVAVLFVHSGNICVVCVDPAELYHVHDTWITYFRQT